MIHNYYERQYILTKRCIQLVAVANSFVVCDIIRPKESGFAAITLKTTSWAVILANICLMIELARIGGEKRKIFEIFAVRLRR